MTFDPDKIVANARHGTGPCVGCPAHADTAGAFVNPGLIDTGAKVMFLTMDPSHRTNWDSYTDWAEYNREKSSLFINKWRGGRALSRLLSEVPGVTINDIWLADAVKCPVNNELAGDLTSSEAFDHCKAYLDDEIATVDPNVIVTLGNDPAEQLLNGVFDRNMGPVKAGTKHCGDIYNTSPPVVISPHWANGWLGRHNNRKKVQQSIVEAMDR